MGCRSTTFGATLSASTNLLRCTSRRTSTSWTFRIHRKLAAHHLMLQHLCRSSRVLKPLTARHSTASPTTSSSIRCFSQGLSTLTTSRQCSISPRRFQFLLKFSRVDSSGCIASLQVSLLSLATCMSVRYACVHSACVSSSIFDLNLSGDLTVYDTVVGCRHSRRL